MPKKIWLATIAIIFFTVLGGSVIALEPVHAVSDAGKEALKFLDNTARTGGLLSGDADAAPDAGETGVLRIISNIINVLLGFVGIIFFIQLFWAGIRWMTSAGNEEVVKEAKQTIKTAVIGIVVVLSAFLITNFVLNQIKSVSTTQEEQIQPSVPTGICRYGSPPDCTNPSKWTELHDVAESFCLFKAIDSGCAKESTDSVPTNAPLFSGWFEN